jgi:hypothetical protein
VLRELIRASARLRVADRFAGPLKEWPYFGNYERQTVPWRLLVPKVNGALAIVGLRQHRDQWRLHSVARLEVIGRCISRIVDYAHCLRGFSRRRPLSSWPRPPKECSRGAYPGSPRSRNGEWECNSRRRENADERAIKFALTASNGAVLSVIDEMSGAATTFPTPNRGCHPLRVLGHLTLVEGMIPSSPRTRSRCGQVSMYRFGASPFPGRLSAVPETGIDDR